MLAIVHDRVQALVESGATFDQVKAAGVTVEYDDLYGANSGAWITDNFIEADYISLKQGRAQPGRKIALRTTKALAPKRRTANHSRFLGGFRKVGIRSRCRLRNRLST
jgi:hypothetical protein